MFVYILAAYLTSLVVGHGSHSHESNSGIKTPPSAPPQKPPPYSPQVPQVPQAPQAPPIPQIPVLPQVPSFQVLPGPCGGCSTNQEISVQPCQGLSTPGLQLPGFLSVISIFGSVGLPCCNEVQACQQQQQKIEAVAVLKGMEEVSGTVRFTQEKESDPVLITGDIRGLKPGKHGFHIHQFGDLTDGCTSAGPHFNPFNQTHGGPESHHRHIGDLGAVTADVYGIAYFGFKDSKITLFGEHSIIGRSVVIHAKDDDLGQGKGESREESLRTGNAGSRLACGVIGYAAPKAKRSTS